MSILISICARGGSKGIPGKNIKPIAGLPLIGYTIRTARSFAARIAEQAVLGLSTDSTVIRDVATQLGLQTDYMRPEALGLDHVGKVDVMRHLLEHHERRLGRRFDYLLDLDVTSPLRTVDDLTSAWDVLKNNSEALNIFSVSKADRNPYFNMVEINAQGFAEVSKKAERTFFSRQSSPAVFSINGSFYFFKRAFFDEGHDSQISDRSLIYEVPHLCFDLDEPKDFLFMKFLIENDQLDFEL